MFPVPTYFSKILLEKKFFNKIFDLFQRFWICANEKVILEIIFESALIKFSIFLNLINYTLVILLRSGIKGIYVRDLAKIMIKLNKLSSN